MAVHRSGSEPSGSALARVYIVEVWPAPAGSPAFRAAVRPVECQERHLVDGPAALLRALGAPGVAAPPLALDGGAA